jgi:two-component system response regulator YesN
MLRQHSVTPKRSEVEGEPVTVQSVAARSKVVKKSRVLIIDDDPSLVESLSAALCPPYHVLSAQTGAAALFLLKSERVDAIILDLRLGSEDGLELLPRLRALTSAPVLLLTAFGTRENLLRAIRAKPDEFLEKPVGVVELRRRVASVLLRADSLDDPVEQVRAWIAREYRQPLTLFCLARRVGMSQVGLRQAFENRVGLTPAAYLMKCRMQQAASLLRDPRQQIKEIAVSVGYPDPNNFSTAFRRFFGVSPRAFRSQPFPSTDVALPSAAHEGNPTEN